MSVVLFVVEVDLLVGGRMVTCKSKSTSFAVTVVAVGL